MSDSAQAPHAENPDPFVADETDETAFADELEDDIWFEEDSGPGIVARMLAEVGGTFIMVLMGLGALLFSGSGNGTLAVALGFGVGVMIAIVIFGRISGAHINPAVTIGFWLSGRFPGRDVVPYVIAQVVGGIAAGAVLLSLIASLPQVPEAALLMSNGANGYGDHSPLGFGLSAALVVEVIIAALLVAVVLSVTSLRASASAATTPVVVGLAFGFLMMLAIPFTNGALSPARAAGAALFAEPWALQQLWVFWVAPIVGAAVAGLLFRAFGPEEDLIIVEQIETVEVIED